MRAVRQAASGLLYGIISLLLVLGSLALAQAQGGTRGASAPTFTPLPSSTATVRPSPVSSPTEAGTTVASATTAAAPATDTPTLIPPTPTKTHAAPRATNTSQLACGTQYGWERTYIVEPGDTLYRIARLYAVSVDALQRANCRSTTVIYVGERLWVPYAKPAATALTIIPTFPTPTEPAVTASADP